MQEREIFFASFLRLNDTETCQTIRCSDKKEADPKGLVSFLYRVS